MPDTTMNEMSNDPGNADDKATHDDSARVVRKKRGKRKVSTSRKAAAKAVAALKAEEAALRSAKSTPDESGLVWYMACPSWHVGMFFTHKPDGILKTTDWWSAQKEPDASWPSDNVPCQVCDTPLRFDVAREGLIPYRRFVLSMPVARFNSLVGKMGSDEVPA